VRLLVGSRGGREWFFLGRQAAELLDQLGLADSDSGISSWKVLMNQDTGRLDILWRSWVHIIQLLGYLALPRIDYRAIEKCRLDNVFAECKLW